MSMRKVITINLNGSAYQVDELGYQALSSYLDRAASQLAGNPDSAEIISDLEQAIGDKCDSFLGAHKNVVTAEEIDTVLREMGPVEAAQASPGATGNSPGIASGAAPDGNARGTGPAAEGPPPPDNAGRPHRKLYRLPERGMLGGVCAGLAAYFDTDVVWVRLGFLVLGCSTGVFILVWLAMLIVVPVARSAEEKAAAHGATLGVDADSQPSRRLFRLPEVGMLGGVCAGVAAYFNLEVVLVRIAFVGLTLITGVWFLIWLALLVLMPVARSPEEFSAAHGDPFSAKDVLDRAKKKSRDYAQAAADLGGDMKKGFDNMKEGLGSMAQNLNTGREHRRDRREERRQARYRSWHRRRDRPVGYGAQVAAGITLPFLSILSAVLFVAFIVALLSLLGHGSIHGWQFFPHAPRWIPVVVLLVVYCLIAGPIGAARRASHRYANGGSRMGWASALDGLLWIALVALLFWGVFHYLPWIHELLQDGQLWQQAGVHAGIDL
jgi:phage shock protein PspC (stress-responsive transcriptional regulator)